MLRKVDLINEARITTASPTTEVKMINPVGLKGVLNEC